MSHGKLTQCHACATWRQARSKPVNNLSDTRAAFIWARIKIRPGCCSETTGLHKFKWLLLRCFLLKGQTILTCRRRWGSRRHCPPPLPCARDCAGQRWGRSSGAAGLTRRGSPAPLPAFAQSPGRPLPRVGAPNCQPPPLQGQANCKLNFSAQLAATFAASFLHSVRGPLSKSISGYHIADRVIITGWRHCPCPLQEVILYHYHVRWGSQEQDLFKRLTPDLEYSERCSWEWGRKESWQRTLATLR